MENNICFKTDARSVKTRKAIKYALMQILKTKDIKDVTIKELTLLSDRNRNSFYTHYHSVYDVLYDVNNDVVGYLNNILRHYSLIDFIKNPSKMLEDIEKFVVSHKKSAYLYMTSTSSTEIINNMKSRLTKQIIRCSEHQTGVENPLLNYLVSFLVTSVFELYYNWLLKEDIEISQITQILNDVVSNGLYSAKKILNLQGALC